MATETSPRPRSATPSTIPQKRPLNLDDEQHAPAVSSPLNPDAASSRARKQPAREQREKKESLKKREAKGVDTTRSATPDTQPTARKSKKVEKTPDVVRPTRYPTKPPARSDLEPPRDPMFNPILSKASRDFNECFEHITNRKAFRYTNCIADPSFPSVHWFRQTEASPYTPRFSFQEASPHILFSDTGTAITTEKGFRMARANVCAREGRWYYECKILSGVKPPSASPTTNTTPTDPATATSHGHVRIGFARREANLDTPVGFDAYSYALRDVSGQKVHLSRPKPFLPAPSSSDSAASSSFCESDIIGLELTLPSLALHRKVVAGNYNRAVDVSDDLDPQYAATASAEIIRDRVPIRYKGVVYFEQFEYSACKELEDLMNPSPSTSSSISATASTAATGAAATAPPNPNHPSIPLRTLPFSSIKVYRNGEYIGTPFTDLLAFLPPASKPAPQQGAREGLDDGMLGYFPAVSCFRGGAVEVNFGPEFWCPPSDLEVRVPSGGVEDSTNEGEGEEEQGVEEEVKKKGKGKGKGARALAARDPATRRQHKQGKNSKLRGMGERYVEQIAEDIMYDLVDEVDFWVLDSAAGPGAEVDNSNVAAPAGIDEVLTAQKGAMASGEIAATEMEGVGLSGAVVEEAGVLGGGGGEIKEIVQEEE
ncbi:MAG: hypothetical protein Q9220_007327 [cf. Caloplaca sp. 1 TL-2023]